MSPQDIRDVLKAVPFKPFRLFTTDGTSYLIPHPDWAFVSVTNTVVGLLPHDGDTPEFPDRKVILSNRHITRIEFVDEATLRS